MFSKKGEPTQGSFHKSIKCIIELMGHCKGSYFNIHIWAWYGYFICSKREIRFHLYFGEELMVV